MKNIIVRNAQREDMAAVLRLIKELAVFENEPQEVEISAEALQQDGFGADPAFHCFVAEVEGKIEGMALVYPRYSTWKGRTVHLEDLIVSENMRGTGIGSALFTAVIRYGYEKDVKRIEWNVLDWNESAIAFYEKNGAKTLRDWDVVQLDEQGIKNYMAKVR